MFHFWGVSLHIPSLTYDDVIVQTSHQVIWIGCPDSVSRLSRSWPMAEVSCYGWLVQMRHDDMVQHWERMDWMNEDWPLCWWPPLSWNDSRAHMKVSKKWGYPQIIQVIWLFKSIQYLKPWKLGYHPWNALGILLGCVGSLHPRTIPKASFDDPLEGLKQQRLLGPGYRVDCNPKGFNDLLSVVCCNMLQWYHESIIFFQM